MPGRPMRWFPVVLMLAILVSALPACSPSSNSAGLAMLSMDQLPTQVQSAPGRVRTAYQFAAANSNVVQNIPCYCGCGGIGHTSNYACYVSGTGPGGVAFDNHALGCSICVDITQDAMRLLREGKSTPEIRAYIDATYSSYGTSNMP